MVTTSLQRRIYLCLLTNTTNIGQVVLCTIDCLIQEHDGPKSLHPYCCTLSQSVSSDTVCIGKHPRNRSPIKVLFNKSNTSSEDSECSSMPDLQVSPTTTANSLSSSTRDMLSKLQYCATSISSSDEDSASLGR